MVVFRVTENINIKTTDGTLVKYLKLRNPSQLLNTSLYISTYDELLHLKEVFSKVNDKYKAKVLKESKITSNNAFPKELGIQNKLEYTHIQNFQTQTSHTLNTREEKDSRFFLNEEATDIDVQLSAFTEEKIHLAILGNVGKHIGQMVASLSALRLLYEHLSKHYEVVMDVYIEASENQFYSRDKTILSSQKYINGIYPLSVSVKKFCEYDFYIDNSSTQKRSFYDKLNYVDAWLYKFGLDYKKILDVKKHNILDMESFRINETLKTKLQQLKKDSKLLLFHPFSADINRSIPKEIATKMLKKLIKKMPDYTIVSVLNIGDIQHENYVNLSEFSKSIQAFIFIVSQMNKIITTDTSTYHISDAFFIPTLVFFYDTAACERLKYYSFCKGIYIEDKSLNFSYFKFGNDELVLHKYETWDKVKMSKVIKLLETI